VTVWFVQVWGCVVVVNGLMAMKIPLTIMIYFEYSLKMIVTLKVIEVAGKSAPLQFPLLCDG
jgi:hypothetical protein